MFPWDILLVCVYFCFYSSSYPRYCDHGGTIKPEKTFFLGATSPLLFSSPTTGTPALPPVHNGKSLLFCLFALLPVNCTTRAQTLDVATSAGADIEERLTLVEASVRVLPAVDPASGSRMLMRLLSPLLHVLAQGLQSATPDETVVRPELFYLLLYFFDCLFGSFKQKTQAAVFVGARCVRSGEARGEGALS